jgi:Xaa-Pro aminopeptidase
MRAVKSRGEIGLLQRAVDATIAAHRAAWRSLKPGLFEYQVMGVMLGAMIDRGCLRPAYPPIIGAGLNSTILHYTDVSGKVQAGDLILMDVGGEYAQYAADITRTVPVNGRFDDHQRVLYEIVLAAQQAAIAAVKPGSSLTGSGHGGLAAVARDVLDRLGRERLGEPLGKYFTHGIGHHVGLEVHDPADAQTPLEAGMVITIEPGVYIPEEKIGIRIEDMIEVTDGGARVMSAALPREPAGIEALLGR